MAKIVLCTVLLICLAQVRAELKLVYFFNRYGARNVLPKSSLLQEANATAGPALLPIGRLQNRGVGSAFRARYLDTKSCGSTCLASSASTKYGVLGDPSVDFHNYNTLVRSSGLDRTVTGANAFLGGVFPDASSPSMPDPLQAPPVLSQTDSEDWLIRSYTKCNVYLDKLAAWYQSDEFKAKEASSKRLRDTIAEAVPGMDTSLKNWGTVTDAFRIWTLFHHGGPYPDIGNTTYQEVVDLGNWLQSKQMSSAMTSNLLGGPLVADMLSYMGKAVAASDKQVYYKLLGISSHYNVHMMVSTALKLDQGQTAASYPWLNKIPNFASLMAFELHQDGSTAAVKLVYKDGPTEQFVTMPLPCAVKGSAAEKIAGTGACSWSDFSAYASQVAIGTSDKWCSLCQNRGVQVCKVYWAKTEQPKAAHARSSSNAELAICGVIVGVSSILLTLAAIFLFNRAMIASKHKHDGLGMHLSSQTSV